MAWLYGPIAPGAAIALAVGAACLFAITIVISVTVSGFVALTLAAFLATQAFAQTYNQWQPPTTAQDPELTSLLDKLEEEKHNIPL